MNHAHSRAQRLRPPAAYIKIGPGRPRRCWSCSRLVPLVRNALELCLLILAGQRGESAKSASQVVALVVVVVDEETISEL